ncbi:MAG: metal-sensing transcriptional repressor [Anaerolineae bacterium]|nr:metal-sensing transcriptional repressor [Anaerolineae bacterium]NIN98931.1 metal-sensing transcriptional repressor [Anaerolineae bacterium]
MKKQVLNRLRSIEGHVRGIERMVENDHYCVDIVKQSLAVQRALDKVNGLILESHLQTCVTTAIRGDESQERERVVRELLEVFETASKL